MSRIGRKPIEIPAGVTVTAVNGEVSVKGPKGELKQQIRPEIEVKVEDGKLVLSEKIKTKKTPALWGLSRALIANMVKGVTEGYEKKLEMVGVGYRAKKDTDRKITLTVGHSHPVVFEAPEGIQLEVEEQTGIIIRGASKQMVGQVAAKIREIRKPEPYKGKGIKYIDEVIRRKAGKAGKALGAGPGGGAAAA
jgi:large subunit ribosomal protein L6